MSSAFDLRVEAAARPYRAAGHYAWYFARGKMRGDPMFRHLMEAPPHVAGGTILDLGCGQGLLFSWLAAADDGGANKGEFHGMELQRDRVETARRVLAGGAHIDCCDIRDAPFPRAALIVIMDVLLYMQPEEQRRVLEKAACALEPGGTLLLREADRGAGARFRATEWGERLANAHRGRLWHALNYRSVQEWRDVLTGLGLSVEVQPMYAGTPFANMLYTGRRL